MRRSPEGPTVLDLSVAMVVPSLTGPVRRGGSGRLLSGVAARGVRGTTRWLHKSTGRVKTLLMDTEFPG